MKLFKTLLALLLALLLVVGCAQTTPTTPEPTEPEPTDPEPTDPEPEPEPEPNENADTLVVGTSGELNGHYYAGVTNSSYDKWIRNLLWDYGTYLSNEGGQFVLNETAVEEPEIVENEDGSKTYTFKVKEGLKWSDGQPITAKDYVFEVLYNASPEWFAAGAGLANSSYDALVGQKAYQSGESNSFPGIKLVDEMTFSATIDPSQLPYFYELAMVAVGPSPMHRFSPNLVIGEDGSSLAVKEGYELTEEDVAAFVEGVNAQIDVLKAEVTAQEEAIATAIADSDAAIKAAEEAGEEVPAAYDPTEDQAALDELKASIDEAVAALEADIAAAEAGESVDAAKTLLRANAYEVFTNFVTAPDVVSGAYKFLVFENQSVTVELNPEYVGDFRGNKPVINRVLLRNVNEELDVDMVINGELDLTAGIIEEGKIQKADSADNVTLVSYPRNGYGVLAFKGAKEPVNLVEVRQAVAFLLDRQAIIDGTSGGYGVVGQGHYGLSQWMYQAKGEEFLDLVEERGTAYAQNIDKANELLDKTPYIYEADGSTPWSAEKAAELAQSDGENFSYWRHNAEGKELAINQGGASAQVLNVIAGQMPATARSAGMKYTTQLIDFNVLLTEYYNLGKLPPEQLTYHAFSLGTSFTAVYDPFYSYHSSMVGTGNNNTDTANPEADRLVTELRQFDASDPDTYAEKWLEWQLWYNENLPDIPLYSQEYFDIVNNRVTGLETTPVWDWSMDIADLRIAE